MQAKLIKIQSKKGEEKRRVNPLCSDTSSDSSCERTTRKTKEKENAPRDKEDARSVTETGMEMEVEMTEMVFAQPTPRSTSRVKKYDDAVRKKEILPPKEE